VGINSSSYYPVNPIPDPKSIHPTKCARRYVFVYPITNPVLGGADFSSLPRIYRKTTSITIKPTMVMICYLHGR
jgi:hypothetical protein